ncbi:hypothetical protein [Thalassoroseus pseudoceratinae]|nr:hypothetical protein [Thalassoroseus pseudoceratinae]
MERKTKQRGQSSKSAWHWKRAATAATLPEIFLNNSASMEHARVLTDGI